MVECKFCSTKSELYLCPVCGLTGQEIAVRRRKTMCEHEGKVCTGRCCCECMNCLDEQDYAGDDE